MNKNEIIINSLIKEEREAIDSYKNAIRRCDDDKCIEVFEHIIEDEEEHIKELEALKQGKNITDSAKRLKELNFIKKKRLLTDSELQEMADCDMTVKDEDEQVYYGLFQKGGSIGQNANAGYRKYPDGILLEVYTDKEEAKNKTSIYRKRLTPGERSYYGMGYSVKPLNKTDLKNEYVQKLINDLTTKVDDSDPWHEQAHYELTFEDGHKETDSIPLYVKRDYSDEEILEYFQGYYDDKIVKVKQVGWSRMGDSILQEYGSIRKQIEAKYGKDIYKYIDKYLKANPELYLSDLYYKKTEWDKFIDWYNKEEK